MAVTGAILHDKSFGHFHLTERSENHPVDTEIDGGGNFAIRRSRLSAELRAPIRLHSG
jgi:hypothetical protein